MALFALVFAFGGIYYLYRSFAVTPPTTTTLTMRSTDGVVSTAICINQSMSATINRKVVNLAACVQTNDPSNPTGVRAGYYDETNLMFYPKTTGWVTSGLSSTLAVTKSFQCSSGASFDGIGSFRVNNINTYFGQFTSSSGRQFGSYNATTKQCSGFTGLHPAVTSTWASSSISCPTTATTVTSFAQLQTAISQRQNTNYCLAPGDYVLTAPLKINISNIRIIGDPVRRPRIDASRVQTTDGQTRSGIIPGAASGVTIANLIVFGAPTPGHSTCPQCGIGIITGPNFRIYNSFLYGNKLNAINGHDSQIENSALVLNGNPGDKNWTSAGVKMAKAYTIMRSYVVGNIGVGIWCDVGCNTTTNHNSFVVRYNYVAANSQAGIRQEISSTPTGIRYNVVENNNTDHTTDNFGGIEAIDTQNVTATSNILKNNWPRAMYVGENVYGSRAPTTSSINFTNNSLGGQTILCASGTSVVCSPNQ